MPAKQLASPRQRLSNAVQASRARAGFTQVQLAERAGVSEATIQQIEGGYPFSRVTRSMRRVADALGWPEGWAHDILAGQQETPPPDTLKGEAEVTPRVVDLVAALRSAISDRPAYTTPPEPPRGAHALSRYITEDSQIYDDIPDAELDRLLILIVDLKARRAARHEMLRQLR